ncbi:MAG: hypothetical protein JWP02_2340, partial [Acidimicrobiales bacterium]|nr:hypothetical protein [Acidimicrobiales bacterium]
QPPPYQPPPQPPGPPPHQPPPQTPGPPQYPPAQQQYPPPYQPPQQADDRRRRTAAWVPWLIVGLVVVVLAGVLVAVLGNKASAGEIFLTPNNDPGANAFTPSAAAPPPARITPPSIAPAQQQGAVTSASGAQPGLYGGTQNNASCNVAQMIDFLGSNPAKADAFASVQRIRRDQIASYLNSLTPVILQSDTRVTNHGFKNGQATSFQAVLQAGTAVLVDNYGIPRVRCACGNPLTPPVAVRSSPTYTGPRWAGFSPTTIVVVNAPTTVINTFVLIDVNTGRQFTRPAGSQGTRDGPAPGAAGGQPPTGGSTLTVPPDLNLGSGDVQATLLWANGSDLDLHVVDPRGDEIYFSRPQSASGGTLDHDDTAGCNSTGTHVENVFWPRGGAPSGRYRVFVKNYDPCPAPAQYELKVTVGGQVIYDRTGTLPATSGAESAPVEFTR